MDRLRTFTVFGRPAALVLGALVFLAAGGLSLSDNLRTGAGPIRPSEELTGLLLDLGLPPFILQDFLLGINAATVCVVFGLFLLLTYCVLTCRPWARTGAMALVICSAVSAIAAHSGAQLFFALVAAAGVFLLLTRHAGAWLRERQPGWRGGTLPRTSDDAADGGAGREASDQGAGSGSRFFDLVAEDVAEDDGEDEEDTGREKNPAAASPVPAATEPAAGPATVPATDPAAGPATLPAAGPATLPASRRTSGRGRPGRAIRGNSRSEPLGPDQPGPDLPAAEGAGAAPGASAGSGRGRGRGRKRKLSVPSKAGRGQLPASPAAAAAAGTSPAGDSPSHRPVAEGSGGRPKGSAEDGGGGEAAALVGADAGPSTQRTKFRGRVKGFLEGRGR